MPTSAWDGRKWVTDRLADLSPSISTLIDVGPGEGTYSILGRHLVWWARWVAVEVHEPYVDRFLLGHKYDDVIVRDIREWWPDWNDYAILFGDVLEHLALDDAVAVLEWHKARATHIYVSVPIHESVQGACFGNPHEEHLTQFTFDQMSALLPDADAFEGVDVGRFWWTREDQR